MISLEKYYNMFSKDTTDTRLRDLLLLGMMMEVQNILTDLLSKNQDPNTLKATKEALTSLKKLKVLMDKTHKKLRTIKRKGVSLEEIIEEEMSHDEQ